MSQSTNIIILPLLVEYRTLASLYITSAAAAAAAAAASLQSCLTLCNPADSSPPGSSVHGIFQARVLEWGAIALTPFIV